MTGLAAIEAADVDLPGLTAAAVEVATVTDPVTAYLARVSSLETKRSVRGYLDRLARMAAGVDLTSTTVDAHSVRWGDLRFAHTAALRARILQQPWSPAYQRKHVSALRSVLREAWRLGLLSAEDYQRAIDLAPIDGTRLPAGRALPPAEVAALLDAAGTHPSRARAVRDAAIIAVTYGTGARRIEVTRADIEDWDRGSRMLRLLGKGDRERSQPVPPWAAAYLDRWLAARGTRRTDLPLFTSVHRHGAIRGTRLHPQSIADVLSAAVAIAGIPAASPHDLRRSYISDLLDAGVDVLQTSRLAGHASPSTTLIYDRRRPRAAQVAVDTRLTDPHVRETA